MRCVSIVCSDSLGFRYPSGSVARLGAKLECRYGPVWYEAGSMVYRPDFKLALATIVWYGAIINPAGRLAPFPGFYSAIQGFLYALARVCTVLRGTIS